MVQVRVILHSLSEVGSQKKALGILKLSLNLVICSDIIYIFKYCYVVLFIAGPLTMTVPVSCCEIQHI